MALNRPSTSAADSSLLAAERTLTWWFIRRRSGHGIQPRTMQEKHAAAKRACPRSNIRLSHAGALFVLDQIDVSENPASRYRPAIRKLRDNPTAEIFVCLYRGSLIAKSIGEDCKCNLRGGVSRRGEPLFATLEKDGARFKLSLGGTSDTIADSHLAVSPAGIEAFRHNAAPLDWSIKG
jgi:hypothetical protein